MPILLQRDADSVRRRFETELKRDIHLTLYTQRTTSLYIPGRGCATCAQTEQLVQEIADLSPRVRLEVVDFYENQQLAADNGVEIIPALTIGTNGSASLRYFGMPSGYELAVLLDAIVAASVRGSSLEVETRRELKALQDDVHIQIFVTPTCTYCPALVALAQAMALESPRVTADVVEVQEFPHFGKLYNVMGVPKTVINGSVQFTGAVPEGVLLNRVLQAVGSREAEDHAHEQTSEQMTPIA